MRFTESRGKRRRLATHSDQMLGRAKMETLEARQLLAGVTVITHGYQALSSARPSWLDDMALTIEQRLGEYVPVYSLRIERGGSGLVGAISRLDALGSTASLNSSSISSGEAIVLLDWADASGVVNSYYSTTLIASYAANVLMTAYPTFGITSPLAELPIHLMGHSRGGSVVSEMSRLLGQQGIIVDQQTTWDPCPVAPDPSAAVYENTLFADNHYQERAVGFFPYSYWPQGALAGAHNIDLQGLSGVDHSGVHTWYDATIPSSPDAADGSAWYSYTSTGPRNQVGFAWSRIGGMPRPVDGMEGATPYTITASGSQLWDNVIVGGLSDDVATYRGDSLTVPLWFDGTNDDASVLIGVDKDSNPYDGVTWLSSRVTAGLSSGEWQAPIDTSTLTPGTYYVSAAITNGTHTRYDYSLGTLRVVARPPTDVSLTDASIPENQAADTIVGHLRTTAAVSDSFTYSLVPGSGSNDNALFWISGDQLVTNESFDYEERRSYQIRLRTTNPYGGYFEKAFAVAVTNVNEAPVDIVLAGGSVAENLPAGTVVGTLSTFDPDAGNTVTNVLVYGAGGVDNALFTISGGQITAKAAFDYEARNTYSVRVRTTDQGGLWYEKAFTINVVNVNETPTDTALAASGFAENQPAGSVAGTLSTSDPDSGGSFAYSLVGGTGSVDNAWFVLVGNVLKTGYPLDYEARNSYSIRIRSTDQGGLWFERVFVVTPADVNEVPTDIVLSNRSVVENRAAGAVVATISAIDPDRGDTFSYSLVAGTGDADNASFTISGSQLETAASFDFEGRNSYSIRIRMTDAGGLWCEKAFTISVTNANEAPADMSFVGGSVAENLPTGTAVGTLSTVDPDFSNGFAYSLVSGEGDADNSLFIVSGSQLKTAASFNYETRNSYSVRVRSRDQGGLFVEKTLAIQVTDVNEGPTTLTLSSSSVAETPLAGAVVGTLAGVDPDQTESLTYSFAGGAAFPDNAMFTIDGTTLRAYAPLDYELKKAYSIRVRVTDKGGLSFKKDMTVTVTDVNETPTNLALASTRITENMLAGTILGSFSTVDPDIGNTFTYTLADGVVDNAAFRIAAGGRLKTAQAFDFETKSSYSIVVRSTDQSGVLFCETPITIKVTNVNEAPTGITLTNSTVMQRLPAGTLVGKFVGADPDAASTLTYSLVIGTGSRDNARFSIMGVKLRTAGVFDYATKSVYKIRVRVTDQGGLWYEKAMVIGVTRA